jgi:hypothetical protein
MALASPLNRLLISRHTILDARSADLALLRRLPRGCLIAPNHSHYFDAQVTFELTRRASRRVIYMATRELFDSAWGLGGWLYQRLGVFSVNRGGSNREGREFARTVLIDGKYDLLMFPEGEVYLLNDLVMQLKPGVARLALEAATELARQRVDRPMWILPVAIKYRYVGDITPALESLTQRLETHTWGKSRSGSLYARIVALGMARLALFEQLHGLEANPDEDLFERIQRLRHHLLRRLESKHLGHVREGFDFDRARKLMIHIQGSLLGARRAGGSGVHDGYVDEPKTADDGPLKEDLEAAKLCARSVAFQDDYLLRYPTPERVAETLVKLEREILGTETRIFGKRRAIIRVASPLNAREFLRDQESSSVDDDTVEALVVGVHEALQGALDSILDEEDVHRRHSNSQFIS